MKYITYFLAFSLFTACTNDSEKNASTDAASQSNSSPQLSIENQQSGAEHNAHYVCADRCAGSGSDSPGNCPVCGKEYVHNDAFHQQQNDNQQPETAVTPDLNINQQNQINLNNAQKSQAEIEDLKKKGAEYLAHYTCPSYCKGSGSSEMGKCPSCGKDYVHNDVFHQLEQSM